MRRWCSRRPDPLRGHASPYETQAAHAALGQITVQAGSACGKIVAVGAPVLKW